MNVDYRDVDRDSRNDCERLARWNNDPAIKHLFNRSGDAESFERPFTAADFQRTGGTPDLQVPFKTLMVLVNDEPVGMAHFAIAGPRLLEPTPRTAWISLMIGEKPLQGRGLGRQVVGHLEELAAEAGATRVEIGVFAYNTVSLHFFTHLGYEEFARIPEHAWWAGQLWDDIRMRKPLQNSSPSRGDQHG